MMSGSFLTSICIHLIIFFIAYFGLPELKKNNFKEIPIDIVEDLPLKKETVTKVVSKKIEKKTSKKEIKSFAKPIIRNQTEKPIPKKKEKTKVIKEKKIEKISIKPKPIKKIKKISSKIKKTNQEIPKVLPKRKQKTKNQKKEMAKSILRTLSKAQAKSKKEEKTTNLKKKIVSVSKNTIKSKKKAKLGISEIDRLKNHVTQCWNAPYGAINNSSSVELKIFTNIDGSVTNVNIINESKYKIDAIFRATADSARRAVLDCSPLPLPKEKYELWRVFIFNFDLRF